jgi:hypothetical protein
MALSSAGPERRQLREQFAKPSEVGGNPSSTKRWNGVPRGTMDEVSSHVGLDLPIVTGKAAEQIVPPRSRIPWWKGLRADSGEKHAPASDTDTAKVDSLKALDPHRPIREADIQSVRPNDTVDPSATLAAWDFCTAN